MSASFALGMNFDFVLVSDGENSLVEGPVD